MTVFVAGWNVVGRSYRNGQIDRGFTLLQLSDGTTMFYPEEASINDALQEERLVHGTDTSEAVANLDHWVKTGKGGPIFSLQKRG